MACNVHLVFTTMQVVLFCHLSEDDYKIYTCFMNPLTPGLPASIKSDSRAAVHLDSWSRGQCWSE